MRFITFLRSPTFALYAIGGWLVSFLTISGSQVHNNFSYLFLLLPTLISIRTAEIKALFGNRLIQYLILVILALATAAALGDGSPLRQLKFGFIVLLFYVAVARLPEISDQTAYHAAWSFLGLLCLYVLINVIWQYTQGQWVFGSRPGNMLAKLENIIYVTNTMGGMMAIITLIGMRLKRYRDILLAHAIVLFFGLVLLQTRSILGLWAATVLLTYAGLYQRRFEHPQKIGIFTLLGPPLVFALGIGGLLLFTSIGDSMLGRQVYRPEIWAGYTAEALRCGILFGCGPDHAFRYIAHDGLTMATPHSVFVTQLYRAGIIGLIPLLILAIRAIVTGYRATSWAGWYFIVGVFGLCFDGNSLIHSPNQRWLVFHLPLALLISQQLHQQYSSTKNNVHNSTPATGAS